MKHNLNVSMSRHIPELCFVEGFLITKWARKDMNSGTINKCGNFSQQPHCFNVTSSVGMGGGGISGGMGSMGCGGISGGGIGGIGGGGIGGSGIGGHW